MAQRLRVLREIDQTIPEFYSGRNIFITGFSGFIGKVLVEKLLRCCPDIGNIYVLIRQKRGKGVQERVDEILKNVLFDTIKSTNVNALKKIIPVTGDFAELGMGISQELRSEIINNVSIIYHVAATVNFDTTLKDAIIYNTRSAREMCQLATEVKNIAVFIHVSTAYCQISESQVYEHTYSPRGNWEQAIEIAENMNPQNIKAITSKYIEGFPNTYTFSKSLAESCVSDMCLGKVPTVIARPTIVTSTQMDPMEGWIDNLNGPVALFTAMKKGILRTFSCQEIKYDLVPVDELIRMLIKASWINSYLDQNEIAVYNVSCNNIQDFCADSVFDAGKYIATQPCMNQIWHYSTFRTNSIFLFYLRVYLFQMIPAFLVDNVLKLLRKKPIAMRIQRKILHANEQVDYFKTNEWIFCNDKYLELDDYLLPEDVYAFRMIFHEYDFRRHFLISTMKTSELVLKEDISDPEKLMMRHKLLAWAHFVIKYMTYLTASIFSYNSILIPLLNVVLNYLESL